MKKFLVNYNLNKFSICLLLFSFGVFLLVDHCLAQKSQKECTGESEFWGCQSPTPECQRLCMNYRVRKTTPCKLECEQACVCEAGYLRDGKNGECVYAAECPKMPAKNVGESKKSSNPKETSLKDSEIEREDEQQL